MATVLKFIVFFWVLVFTTNSYCQNLSVTKVQDLNFGAFTNKKAGGTVVINNNGDRTVTGDILPLYGGVSFYTALFEVEAPSGTVVTVMNGPDTVLSGSNGGTMTLQLGLSRPTSPFLIVSDPPNRTEVRIGGTLLVGNLSETPPGNYSGSFYITFNNE